MEVLQTDPMQGMSAALFNFVAFCQFCCEICRFCRQSFIKRTIALYIVYQRFLGVILK